MPRCNVVVIGSANMDLVATAPHIPVPGETIIGTAFRTVHGGKGANQALAAARLGESTAFVGCVGEDDFGRSLRQGLLDAGVNCGHLRSRAGISTGVALIVVSDAGENAICVAPGANACLCPDDLRAATPLIRSAAVCVLQLEIAIETALAAIEIARRHRVRVILDPAPAPANPPAALLNVDVLTPNESEAARLLGGALPAGEPRAIASALRERGARTVVLKRGSRGAFLLSEEGDATVPAPRVDVVDTTGAGDAFTAGLAVAMARGQSPIEATRYAVAAGALACTRFGAAPSMPTQSAVDALLRST
jgi:ribokinase